MPAARSSNASEQRNRAAQPVAARSSVQYAKATRVENTPHAVDDPFRRRVPWMSAEDIRDVVEGLHLSCRRDGVFPRHSGKEQVVWIDTSASHGCSDSSLAGTHRA